MIARDVEALPGFLDGLLADQPALPRLGLFIADGRSSLPIGMRTSAPGRNAGMSASPRHTLPDRSRSAARTRERDIEIGLAYSILHRQSILFEIVPHDRMLDRDG